jgi:acetolactate synthase-1/2/3 large subunit
LPEDAVLTNDAGNFATFVHRYWRYNHPRTQLAPANGAMGYGVPAAVAAKLAAPERRVVALAGDGGFLMTGQELETAVRYGASILVVVFRNGMHGTIAMHQARELGRTAGTEIGEVDLASYARSLGAEGYTVRDPRELVPALEGALASEAVALVDVVTDPDIISPSARLSELVGTEAEE